MVFNFGKKVLPLDVHQKLYFKTLLRNFPSELPENSVLKFVLKKICEKSVLKILILQFTTCSSVVKVKFRLAA